jgi:hypothetical protein
MRLSPHTARASTNAPFTGRGMRTFSIPSRYFAEDDTRSTFRWITQARASSYLAAPLSTNSCFGVTINSLVTRDQVEVCPLSRGVMLPVWIGATPIRLVTRRPSLSPPSFTHSPIDLPCGSLSQKGGLWVYHVSSAYPRGLGLASLPVVQRLRLVR